MIVVLWLSLVITSLALSFSQYARLDIQAAAHYVESTESKFAMDGALNYYKLVIEQALIESETPDASLYENEALEIGYSTLWLLGRNINDEDEHTHHFGLVDECGKLDLNTATKEMLLKLPVMDSALVDALIDWRDSDDEPSDEGAETDYYLSLEEGYQCKNGPFESLEELRLVKGFDLSIIYGEDTNRNGVLDDQEDDADLNLPVDDKNGTLRKGLSEYLTLYSAQPNEQSDGSARIDITEDQELRSFFLSKFGNERGNVLYSKRSIANNVKSIFEFIYRIDATSDEYAQLADGLSLSSDSETKGQINIFSASKEVLLCLPGLDESLVTEIVQYRSITEDRQNDLLWLVEVLGEEKALQVGPYITHKSRTYSADIISLGQHKKSFSRSYHILRYQDEEVKLLWREEMGHLGWPLADELLEKVL